MRETIAISFRAIESIGRGLVWKSNFNLKFIWILLFMLFTKIYLILKVFLVRKITAPDNGVLYAMKVLKKATLKRKKIIKNNNK
jgi:hypothetical protein